MSADAPAVFGAAIEVPEYSRYHWLDHDAPEMSVASCERQERTQAPGAATSGLRRPSSTGPRLLVVASESGAPPPRLWWLATANWFLAVAGGEMVSPLLPSFPAENSTVIPS